MKIIANPTSRAGRGQRLWPAWQQGLKAHGINFSWHVSASNADCVSTAGTSGMPVVAAGGDGTINAVLNGLMVAAQPQAMGVLYSGTSPDFCRFHNIPVNPNAALKTLLKNATQAVDVAEIAYSDMNGRCARGFFTSSCNIGIGSYVAAFANKRRKYLGDTLGTGLGLLCAMLTHKAFACTLTLDGEVYDFRRANHIIIMKNPYIASGIKLNANLKPNDGKLLAVVMHDRSRLSLLKLVAALYKGTLTQKPGVFMRFCRSVHVNAATAQTLEFDGDPHGYTPAVITVKPKALTLICGGNHA